MDQASIQTKQDCAVCPSADMANNSNNVQGFVHCPDGYMDGGHFYGRQKKSWLVTTGSASSPVSTSQGNDDYDELHIGYT